MRESPFSGSQVDKNRVTRRGPQGSKGRNGGWRRRWRHVRKRAYLQARGILVSSQSRGNLVTSGRSLDLLLHGVVADPDADAGRAAAASPAGSIHWLAGELAE